MFNAIFNLHYLKFHLFIKIVAYPCDTHYSLTLLDHDYCVLLARFTCSIHLVIFYFIWPSHSISSYLSNFEPKVS